jgi:hypothetical protein
MVVAPAGNQLSPVRRYPAALAMKGAPFANVVGVGSIDDLNPPDPPATGYVPVTSPSFTNHDLPPTYFGTGDAWVTCSAVGSNVVSTFLPVNMNVEDFDTTGLANNQYPFGTSGNGWAVWNGTSFATPKVVAGIAQQLGAGATTPPTAWQNLLTTGTPVPNLGTAFPGLH